MSLLARTYRAPNAFLADYEDKALGKLVWATAAIAYDANRAYALTMGDVTFLPWPSATGWQVLSYVKGVLAILRKEVTTPEQLHEIWMADRRAHGWTFGPKKDEKKRTHPLLIPFAELEPRAQVKDLLFFNVVSSILSDAYPKWRVATEQR